jgi:putative ABC transport system permease protein
MKRSVAGRLSATGVFSTRWLVAAEFALAVVLLCGAGLMVNTLIRMRSVDLGFDPSRVIVSTVSPPVARYPTVDQRFASQMDLLDRVRRIPGVQVAGAIDSLQMGGAAPPRGLGKGLPSGIGLWSVAPGYFQAMSVPILQGRDFVSRETAHEVHSAIVNQAAAAILWPGEAAVGKLLRLEGSLPLEIVGLVKDARPGYGRKAVPAVYRPLSRDGFRTMTIVVRADEPVPPVSRAMRTEAQRLDPLLVVAPPVTLAALLSEGVAGTRFQTTLFSLFAVMGLLLAGVGIYGVTAYWVTSRTHEIGVRLALGADPRWLRLLVLGQASRPVFTGLAIGLTAAFGLTRQLQASLYGVTPYDPLTLAAASTALVAAGLIAAYIPARRASQVDPLVALRTD